jgi:hypothetical protein
LALNQETAGSIPAWPTKRARIPIWQRSSPEKAVTYRFESDGAHHADVLQSGREPRLRTVELVVRIHSSAPWPRGGTADALVLEASVLVAWGFKSLRGHHLRA